jgi:hypothetical protein
MNFSFTGKRHIKPSTPGAAAVNPFADQEEERKAEPPTSKPLDYLKIKFYHERKTATEDNTASVSLEETIEKDREYALKRREEILSRKPKAVLSSSTADLKQSGLVILHPEKDPGVRGESKHISRMVETSQVNDRFKNLLKMKTAEREKEKAEAEFGQRPDEFVTKAYLKQKEENLRLEKELEARESTKKDLTNMFREMLGSGSYARTNVVDTTKESHSTSVSSEILGRIAGTTEDKSLEPSKELVEKVLSKLVPESAEEVQRAIHQQAKQEALRIVQQIEHLVDQEDEEDKQLARQSAKERYLARKRQRQENDDD